MRASEVIKEFRSRLASIRGHRVLVTAADGVAQTGPITAYDIATVKADEGDAEVCLVLVFPDPPAGQERPMLAAELVDSLGPLASDHPQFTVVARVEMSLEVGGTTWSNYDMPVVNLGGVLDQAIVLLGVDGLRELQKMADA